jgi:hypothetical protein
VSSTDDEKDETKGTGRPNAYWQRIRLEQQQGEPEPDNFGGGFRGVPPAPHGGAAAVKPDDTIGSDDLCWCGRPAGHDWPGKDRGRKHPREEPTLNTRTTEHVDRRDLRAYHSRLLDFILQCVNDDGLRYRVGKNSTILYPPDSTAPATVYARNTERQVRQLQKWYVNHVYPFKKDPNEQPVEPAQVEALAQAVNDPNEHPPKEEPALVTSPDEPEEPDVPDVPEYPEADDEDEEWRPWMRENGTMHELIETNGTFIRCKACEGTDHPLHSDNPRSIGGHVRIHHTNVANLYDPETRAKATDSKRANRQQAAIIEAIETLLPMVPGVFATTVEFTKLKKENADLREKVQGLRMELAEVRGQLEARPEQTEELDAAIKRAEDAEARLAIMREALSL